MPATLVTIWLLHLVATMTPGANTVLVMQVAASGMQGAAARAAAGIATGSALWAALAVAGVGTLLNAFPDVRAAALAAGGAYLAWLGGKFCLSARACTAPDCGIRRHDHAFRVGLLTNLTNPKAVLFFGSIFAAAFPADPPGWLPAVAILIVLLNALSWYGLVAYLFSRGPVRTWYSAHSHRLSATVGVILGATGLKLIRESYGVMRP
ncbi:LysE family transporter [Aromatoleum toluclasticum]|uniref:LysE family transporter n=1 Tax=Aromatoleum toluclasticum TaxID=92003 RepID=UPI00036D501A|nr:LysE family transporter [Aromatoleum toluclasticum]